MQHDPSQHNFSRCYPSQHNSLQHAFSRHCSSQCCFSQHGLSIAQDAFAFSQQSNSLAEPSGWRLSCSTAPAGVSQTSSTVQATQVSSIAYGLLGLLILLLITAPSASAQSYDLNKFRPATLNYSASKFFLSAQTQVRQYLVPQEQATAELLPVPEGKGLAPSQKQVIRQTILTDALGLKSQIDVWLNPDARILQRTSLSSGRKDRYRLYRYMEGGAYSVKRHPANEQERKLPVNRWSDVAEDYYRTGDQQAFDFSEPEALFYLVNVANLNRPGDRVSIPVFDNDEVVQVSVAVVGTESLLVNFKEITDNGERRVSEKIRVIRAKVSARPVDPEQGESDFNFLGYKGDIDIFIDAERRIIVQLTGSYDYVGTVNIRLQDVDFRGSRK